ncbi:MAG: LURP-one-related family protein [Clostridia bacterium]|nr:LURP-one-related family protein [Clostridia bacterium]
MKLLFKQRLFSWLDSYDIYDETGAVMFSVKGELAFGHQLRIYDAAGNPIGCVKQRILTFLPKFELYRGEEYLGSICREFTFFKPSYNIDFCGWNVQGDWFEWDYQITDALGDTVATISKQIWNWTDTYTIDVADPKDAFYALMLVLAIDAEKCSRKD